MVQRTSDGSEQRIKYPRTYIYTYIGGGIYALIIIDLVGRDSGNKVEIRSIFDGLDYGIIAADPVTVPDGI